MDGSSKLITDLEEITLDYFNFIEKVLKIELKKFKRELYYLGLKKTMELFHKSLDKMAREFFLEFFRGFYWMDHWYFMKVGKPEIKIVANTSDGTERTFRGILGGHTSGVSFLPVSARTVGETIFSAIINFDTGKIALANSEEILRNDFNSHPDGWKIDERVGFVELKDREEIEKEIALYRKSFGNFRILDPGCFSMAVMAVCFGGLHFYADFTNDPPDVSHVPPLYLFSRHSKCKWRFEINGKWVDVSHVPLSVGKKWRFYLLGKNYNLFKSP